MDIRRLCALGLIDSEARVLASAIRLGRAGAKDLALDSGVPYSRIYATLASLLDDGWVHKEEGRPARYYVSDLEARVHRQAEHVEREALRAVEDMRATAPAEGTALSPTARILHGWDAFFSRMGAFLSASPSMVAVFGFGSEQALGRLADLFKTQYVRGKAYVREDVVAQACARRHISSWGMETRPLPFTPPVWLFVFAGQDILVVVPRDPGVRCTSVEITLLEMRHFVMGLCSSASWPPPMLIHSLFAAEDVNHGE
jgi:DNA-binding MarR family transcriptional regulator